MTHPREPIKHTCPDIDKYIKWIKSAILDSREIERIDHEDLKDAARSMASQLEDCINYLEELRSSNATLRDWGVYEADEVDSLNQRIEVLESNIIV